MRKQIFLSLLLCLIVTFAMSGCVKVVEIGKEDKLTGNKKIPSNTRREKIFFES